MRVIAFLLLLPALVFAGQGMAPLSAGPWGGGGGGGIAIGNTTKARSTSTSSLVSSAITVNAGSTVCVCLAGDSTSGYNLPTGTSGTFVQMGAQNASGGGYAQQSWCAPNVSASGSYQVTNTTGSAGNLVQHVLEIRNASTAANLDGPAYAATGDGASPFTVTMAGAMAQAANMALSCVVTDAGAGGTFAESTGFTIATEETDGATYWTSAFGYKVTAATTALTPSWTQTGGSPSQARLNVGAVKQ